jgi:hypothetical protein
MKSKSLLSMMDDDLKKWRAGGRSKRTYLLPPTLAILAVILFRINLAPPALFAQTGGPGWHRGPGPMGAPNRSWDGSATSSISPMLRSQRSSHFLKTNISS